MALPINSDQKGAKMPYQIVTDKDGKKWIFQFGDPWLGSEDMIIPFDEHKNERTEDMSFPLTQKDRMLTLQFSFPNDDAVPIGLRSLGAEDGATAAKRKLAKAAPNGKDLLDGNFPERTSLSELPSGLARNDFVLVNASYQKRQDQHDKSKTYHMIRFTFVRKCFEETDDEQLKKFLPFRGLALSELQGVCELALWRVRLFRNPYFKDGTVSPSETMISINLEARVPLFERNNVTLCILPECQPKFSMRLTNDEIRIGPTLKS